MNKAGRPLQMILILNSGLIFLVLRHNEDKLYE